MPRLRRMPRRGAAVLVVLVLVGVIATLAGAMVWQQARAVQVEAAERGRVQALWLLRGAADWVRLILAEDARSNRATRRNAAWATEFKEARLATLLADIAGQSSTSAFDDALARDAFLSGRIVDAQARWNLRQIFGGDGQPIPEQVQVLERLCVSAGLPASTAQVVVAGLQAARRTDDAAPLLPHRAEDLTWLDLSPEAAQALATRVVWLPTTTALNINTAEADVLAAVLPGADAGMAERLRRAAPFEGIDDAAAAAGVASATWRNTSITVRSDWFEVDGALRLDDRVARRRWLVLRRGTQTEIVDERAPGVLGVDLAGGAAAARPRSP